MKHLTTKILQPFLFILLTVFALLLAFGGNGFSAVTEGVKLWAVCVLPALFPYFFITAILTKLSFPRKLGVFLSPVTKKVFNVNGLVGYAFFMSIISGYPIGASITAELTKNRLLSNAEAVRCSTLCSTSSPMFLIGSVGTIMFKNRTFGILLFICHLISALINGFIFSFYKHSEKPQNFTRFLPTAKTDNLLYDSVYSSVISILVVGGIITIFYLITHLLLTYHVLDPAIFIMQKLTGNETLAKGVILSVFECTTGIKNIATCGINFWTLPIVSAVCGFGGISVMMQSLAYLKNAKIKTTPFVLSKLTSAIINFSIALIFSICLF